MIAYAVGDPDNPRSHVILDDDPLTLSFRDGWAVFEDGNGICYAVPAGAGVHIRRLEPQELPAPPDQEPEKE